MAGSPPLLLDTRVLVSQLPFESRKGRSVRSHQSLCHRKAGIPDHARSHSLPSEDKNESRGTCSSLAMDKQNHPRPRDTRIGVPPHHEVSASFALRRSMRSSIIVIRSSSNWSGYFFSAYSRNSGQSTGPFSGNGGRCPVRESTLSSGIPAKVASFLQDTVDGQSFPESHRLTVAWLTPKSRASWLGKRPRRLITSRKNVTKGSSGVRTRTCYYSGGHLSTCDKRLLKSDVFQQQISRKVAFVRTLAGLSGMFARRIVPNFRGYGYAIFVGRVPNLGSGYFELALAILTLLFHGRIMYACGQTKTLCVSTLNTEMGQDWRRLGGYGGHRRVQGEYAIDRCQDACLEERFSLPV